MPNKERGEVSFEYKNKTWILKYDFNAFCELEELLDKPVQVILQDFTSGASMGFREMRKFFLAGAKPPESEDKSFPLVISEQLVYMGKVIEGIGGIAKAQGLIVNAITLAFPEDKKEGQTKKSKADAGSGAS